MAAERDPGASRRSALKKLKQVKETTIRKDRQRRNAEEQPNGKAGGKKG